VDAFPRVDGKRVLNAGGPRWWNRWFALLDCRAMSHREYRVLTAVGPDRPGIVQEVSRVLLECGANLEDSRMAILGGEFALIVLCAGPATALESLLSRTPALEASLGLRVTLKPTSGPSGGGAFLPYRLRVTGVDRPGIVAAVSAVLAAARVNVASLESRVQNAALSGTPMFQLTAELQVPSEVALASLRRDLGRVADDENLDLQLEAG